MHTKKENFHARRIFHFLGLAARAECDASHLKMLAETAAELSSESPRWDGVTALAEAQGVAPLLYAHLKEAGAEPPLNVKRELQGLYLRHRLANEIRMRQLIKILASFDSANIPVLVLKGAALSSLIYAEPGLRPFNDLDILVPKSAIKQVQRFLADLGFSVPLSPFLPGRVFFPKHLPKAVLQTDGISVIVEVHFNLFSEYESVSMRIEDLGDPPLSFPLEPDGIMAQTLGFEETLWYLCLHLCRTHPLYGESRLIWMADIVSFAERFQREIDWEMIRKHYPFVLQTLSLLHFITPLSQSLLAQAPLKIGNEPQGIGEDFRGVPQSLFPVEGIKRYFHDLRDIFFPSEWWLRLHYGLGSVRPLFWDRWVRHPLSILRLTNRLLLRRLVPPE